MTDEQNIEMGDVGQGPCMTLPNGDIIRVGEYGRTRAGERVGPAKHRPIGEDCCNWQVGAETYYDDGEWSAYSVCNPHDIIAKWRDQPGDTGTLAELDVQPGDVVECVDVGVTAEHMRKGKLYKIQDGPTIETEKGRMWGRGPKAHTGWPSFCQYRLISRAIQPETPVRWRDMTPEQKGALLLAHHEGKVIEWNASPGDADFRVSTIVGAKPVWDDQHAYRIRPEPQRETVKRSLHGDKFIGYVAIDTLDGEYQWDTLRKLEDEE